MYEHVTVVGERGQITIPKDIREKEGLKPKDHVIVKIENDRIVVEKKLGKKQMQLLMAEGYRRMAGLDEQVEDDFRFASGEADAMLDDY